MKSQTYKIEKKSETKGYFYVTKVFDGGYEHTDTYKVTRIRRHGFGKGIEIRFTGFSAPTFSLKNLMEIAEFFGTNDIDFDNSINEDGCPTCGAGSESGYELQIYRITKNYPFK